MSTSSSSSDQIKDFVRQYLETAWNSQKLEEAITLPEQMQENSRGKMQFRDDLCSIENLPSVYLGSERLVISLVHVRQIVRKTFPDLCLTISDLLVEGEKVAVRWILHGTDLGGYDNHLPTGKSISITGISMLRLENESIMEEWIEVDIAGMLRQLGYVYMPQPPRITMRRSRPSFPSRKEDV